MSYTDQQIEFLCRFENGNNWSLAQEDNLELLLMLDSDGLLSHHEDTKPDWITLSEKGKQVVFNYREKLHMLEKVARQESENKRQQRFENKVAVTNILITVVVYILGLISEHFGNFIGMFISLFH